MAAETSKPQTLAQIRAAKESPTRTSGDTTADKEKGKADYVKTEVEETKLHQVTDIGHGRKLVVTNDTDKALEEIDLAPHNVDVVNNGVVVWTGDLTDRYVDDLLSDN